MPRMNAATRAQRARAATSAMQSDVEQERERITARVRLVAESLTQSPSHAPTVRASAEELIAAYADLMRNDAKWYGYTIGLTVNDDE